MKRLVFLDFDGVVMTWTSYERFRGHPLRERLSPTHRCREFLGCYLHLEPECVARVDELCRRADADIVLSTAWRPSDPSRRPSLVRALRKAGLTAKVVGQTPRLTDAPRTLDQPELGRGHEILAWLNRHRRGWSADPRSFVVLDDCHLDEELTETRWVQSDMHGGFLPEHLEQALELFGVGP